MRRREPAADGGMPQRLRRFSASDWVDDTIPPPIPGWPEDTAAWIKIEALRRWNHARAEYFTAQGLDPWGRARR